MVTLTDGYVRRGERACMERPRVVLMLSCLSLAAPASRIDAQANCLPFGPGESLAYDVRAGRLGVRGDARFTVAGPMSFACGSIFRR